MDTAAQILAVLDECAGSFSFPMLDNGYVYLAATRLGAYRSASDWALTIEVFGFSPRAGVPDLHVHTFASRLHARDAVDDYVDAEAHANYLANNPHNDSRFFNPFDYDAWLEISDEEVLADGVSHVVLRGEPVPLPPLETYAAFDIELRDPPTIEVHEACRYFAATQRDRVLGTPAERRVSVPPDLTELLVLDEWHHPDLIADELPSATEAFQQLALVLETGDPDRYRPTLAPNTHWRNWPEGGSL